MSSRHWTILCCLMMIGLAAQGVASILTSPPSVKELTACREACGPLGMDHMGRSDGCVCRRVEESHGQ